MKRDLDLIRLIMLNLEAKEDDHVIRDLKIDGYSSGLINYHLILLRDAGFIACEATKSSTSDRIIEVFPAYLTWNGQEFLAACKNETIWNEVKAKAGNRFESITFGVLEAMLAAAAKSGLGL